MRKIKRITIIILLMSVCIINIPVEASPATSYTMTINSKGQYVRTQDAYLPDKTIIDLNLRGALDMMFDHNDYLYIADTGNRRIIKYDPYANEVLQIITHPEFSSPKGVFISDLGIYVADSSAEAVFRFDVDGNHMQTFYRPTTVSFSDTPFNPSKVVVDNRGNMYIYGEGVSNGIIQLSNTGDFSGYFTSNRVQLSLTQQIYKLIFNEEQFENFATRVPSTFSNVFIDQNSMIYTTTMGTYRQAIKKHNTQGGNIFTERTLAFDDARTLYVDAQGIVYAGMQRGNIFVYTPDGEFIFNFGANTVAAGQVSVDISGLFSRLSTIAVDSNRVIWAIDDSKNFLQSFAPTEYALKIYEALAYYEARQYALAIEIWTDVLRLNQMSVIAHNSIAKNYLQQEDYELAMYHFELAGNRLGYSDAFWEVRNATIQQALGAIIIVIVSLLVISKTMTIVDRKTGKITLLMSYPKRKFDYKIIKDLLYIFRVMIHPLDSYYEMKKERKATWKSALILYLLIFLLFINYSVNKGFIYQFVAIEDIDLTSLVLGFFALTMLFVISNYLDTSIHDGVGNIRQIFIMFVYALGPLLIALPVTTFLSHHLTYNETFFLSFTMLVGYGWSALNIFLGIIETHDYTARQTFKSILITLLFALIITVVLIIIIMMWEQLYQFVEAIIKEVFRNVTQ